MTKIKNNCINKVIQNQTKIKPMHYKKASKLGLYRDKIKDKPFIDDVTDCKRDNDLLAYYYAHTGLEAEHPKTIERIKTCRQHIKAVHGADKGHIIETFSCGNRFCPACAKALSLKNSLMMTSIFRYLTDTSVTKKFDCYSRKFKTLKFLFLTLTVPNCTGEDLPEVIKSMIAGFKRMFERKEIQELCLGYIRKLEITLNLLSESGSKIYSHSVVEGAQSNDDFDYYSMNTGIVNKFSDKLANDPNFKDEVVHGYNFHPHFHVLIAVRNCYGSNGHSFITTERFSELWSQSMRSSDALIVDVRKVSGEGSVPEISKYLAKKEDYLHSAQVFRYFYQSLYYKKMLAYSGIFKACVSLFKNGDLDKYIPNEYIPIDSYMTLNYFEKEHTVDFYQDKNNKMCLVGNENYRNINNPRRTVFDSILKKNAYKDNTVFLKQVMNDNPELFSYIKDLMARHRMCLVYEEFRFKRNNNEYDPGFYFYRMTKQEYEDYCNSRDEQFLNSIESELPWDFEVNEFRNIPSAFGDDDISNIITGNLNIVANNEQLQLTLNLPTALPWGY